MSDIIIAGAGPIGLMLANLLAEKSSLSITVLEQQEKLLETSRAIGVTPPSLDLFERLGLNEELINTGVSITTAMVHSREKEIGALHFDTLNEPHSFILSTPQYKTEQILEKNLEKFSNVTVLRGMRVIGVQNSNTSVTVTAIESNGTETREFTGKYLCACDGGNSIIRDLTGVQRKGSRYHDTFVMGDFVDRTTLGNEAHLYFTNEGAIESFPLPDGKRRWVVQTESFVATPVVSKHLEFVQKRSGVTLDPRDNFWLSPFGVQHYQNERYWKENVFFAGDAAHTMSPIGGQGMNTGFGDAEFLAEVLLYSLRHGKRNDALLMAYEKCRKEAVNAATSRAWISMRIGTAQGPFAPARDFLLKTFLNSPLKKWGAPHFAMKTIPCGTLNDAIAKYPDLLAPLSEPENQTTTDGK